MTSQEERDIVSRLRARSAEQRRNNSYLIDAAMDEEAAGTIERLREALTFYRDQWFQNAEGDGSTPGLLRTWQEPTGALWDDAGAKARQALDPRP